MSIESNPKAVLVGQDENKPTGCFVQITRRKTDGSRETGLVFVRDVTVRIENGKRELVSIAGPK